MLSQMICSVTGWRLKMSIPSLFLLLLLPLAVPAAESVVITSVEWARPRSGESLARMPGLAKAATSLVGTRNSRLLIRYPGGEEGVLWAEELRSWLVALGIASSRIELVPGAGRADAIVLELSTGTGWER